MKAPGSLWGSGIVVPHFEEPEVEVRPQILPPKIYPAMPVGMPVYTGRFMQHSLMRFREVIEEEEEVRAHILKDSFGVPKPKSIIQPQPAWDPAMWAKSAKGYFVSVQLNSVVAGFGGGVYGTNRWAQIGGITTDQESGFPVRKDSVSSWLSLQADENQANPPSSDCYVEVWSHGGPHGPSGTPTVIGTVYWDGSSYLASGSVEALLHAGDHVTFKYISGTTNAANVILLWEYRWVKYV